MNGPTSSIPVATPDPVKASAGSETMADRATRLLEDAIVRLDLPPGMRITENELALRFGLGRTPVREAVQRLVADGLLVVFPRKGMTVGVINPLDVLLALDVRGPVERVVAVSAARRATPAQRDALLRAGQGMEEAAAAGDSVRYMHGDKDFDTLIGTIAANPFAQRALAPLQSMSRRAWYYFRRDRDLVITAAHHAELAGAVSRGDPDSAGQASDHLIAHIRSGLKQALSEL